MAERVEIKVTIDADQAAKELEDFRKDAEAAEKAVGRINRPRGGRGGGFGGAGRRGGFGGVGRMAGQVAKILGIVAVIVVVVKTVLDNVALITKGVQALGLTNIAKNIQDFGDGVNAKIDRLTTLFEVVQRTAATSAAFGRTSSRISASGALSVAAEFSRQAERRRAEERRRRDQSSIDYGKAILGTFGFGGS